MGTPAIVAVLVLYCRGAGESEAFVSLSSAAHSLPALAGSMQLLVYDNSPESHILPSSGLTVIYRHDPSNGGLAPAYNAALRLAKDTGAEWLLLLDQDTTLTEAYLRELLTFVDTPPQSEVVAAVPKLVDGSVVLSPKREPRLTHSDLPVNVTGILQRPVMAYNSGALLRVDAVRAIGGFPQEFTLDFLDHVVFHKLQRCGGRVWLMRSSLPHQLSTRTLGREMPLARYRRMLRNERRFYRDVAGWQGSFWYRLRLLRRAAGHALHAHRRRFSLLELRSLLGLPL